MKTIWRFLLVILLTSFASFAEENNVTPNKNYEKLNKKLLDAETKHILEVDALTKSLEISALKLRIEQNKAQTRIQKAETGKKEESSSAEPNRQIAARELRRIEAPRVSNTQNNMSSNSDLQLQSSVTIDGQMYLNITYQNEDYKIKIDETLDGWSFRLKNNKIIATKKNMKKVF